MNLGNYVVRETVYYDRKDKIASISVEKPYFSEHVNGSDYIIGSYIEDGYLFSKHINRHVYFDYEEAYNCYEKLLLKPKAGK